MLANVDDAILEAAQLNMPGTVFEFPNWRRKLSMPIERLATDNFVAELAKAIADERESAKPGAS
jgi:4-alpha-glucanotransferase